MNDQDYTVLNNWKVNASLVKNLISTNIVAILTHKVQPWGTGPNKRQSCSECKCKCLLFYWVVKVNQTHLSFWVNILKVATYWRSTTTTNTLPETAPQTRVQSTIAIVKYVSNSGTQLFKIFKTHCFSSIINIRVFNACDYNQI